MRAYGIALGAVVLCAVGDVAQASGYTIPGAGGKGLGNASAGAAARGEDAGTVFHNPAGMTRIDESRVDATVQVIRLTGRWRDRGSTHATGAPLTGSNGLDGGGTAAVPQTFVVLKLDDRTRLGLGVNAPFGLKTDWGSGWVGRYQATLSEINCLNVNPSIGYRVDDHWSVGAGVNYQQAYLRLENAVDFGLIGASFGVPGLAPQQNDGRVKLEGDDSASWGANLGVLYEPSPRTRIGLSWRGQVTHSIRGDVDFVLPREAAPLQAGGAFTNTRFKTRLHNPENIELGVAHELDDAITLFAGVTWTRWSRAEDLDIKFNNPAQPADVTELNWKDVWNPAIGLAYRADEHWTCNVGLAYENAAVPTSTRGPRLPGSHRFWTALGIAYRPNDHSEWELSYARLWMGEPSIHSSTPAGGSLNGYMKVGIELLTLSYSLEF